MSIKLACGCKDIKMCAMHEEQWWARHAEALRRQAEEQGYAISKLRGQVEPSNLDLIGG